MILKYVKVDHEPIMSRNFTISLLTIKRNGKAYSLQKKKQKYILDIYKFELEESIEKQKVLKTAEFPL